MTFDEYQEKTKETAIYPSVGERFVYPTLGLLGEAGEVAEKVKKIFRDEGGVVTPEKREEIKKEMGDVLWYLSQLAAELGLSLKEIAADNVKKLESRKIRGTLNGNGDNR